MNECGEWLYDGMGDVTMDAGGGCVVNMEMWNMWLL